MARLCPTCHQEVRQLRPGDLTLGQIDNLAWEVAQQYGWKTEAGMRMYLAVNIRISEKRFGTRAELLPWYHKYFASNRGS